MDRRHFLAAAAATLATPHGARAQPARVLKFVPQADLAVLDPITNVSYVTRNHALMVFDTLYGVDTKNRPQLQMLERHDVTPDGLEWVLTLRKGLVFHDGSPVRAQDAVTSLQRWSKRDNAGQALMAVTEESFGGRRSADPVPAEAAFLTPARCARQDRHQHRRHHAGASGGHGRGQAVDGDGRQRPLSLRRRGACSRLAGGLIERFAGYVPRDGGATAALGRAEDRAFRPGGMAHDPGCVDRRGGAANR